MSVPEVKVEFTEAQREQLRLVGERVGVAMAGMFRTWRVAGVRVRLGMLQGERRRLVREHRRRVADVDEQIGAARAELAELAREAGGA